MIRVNKYGPGKYRNTQRCVAYALITEVADIPIGCSKELEVKTMRGLINKIEREFKKDIAIHNSRIEEYKISQPEGR